MAENDQTQQQQAENPVNKVPPENPWKRMPSWADIADNEAVAAVPEDLFPSLDVAKSTKVKKSSPPITGQFIPAKASSSKYEAPKDRSSEPPKGPSSTYELPKGPSSTYELPKGPSSMYGSNPTYELPKNSSSRYQPPRSLSSTNEDSRYTREGEYSNRRYTGDGYNYARTERYADAPAPSKADMADSWRARRVSPDAYYYEDDNRGRRRDNSNFISHGLADSEARWESKFVPTASFSGNGERRNGRYNNNFRHDDYNQNRKNVVDRKIENPRADGKVKADAVIPVAVPEEPPQDLVFEFWGLESEKIESSGKVKDDAVIKVVPEEPLIYFGQFTDGVALRPVENVTLDVKSVNIVSGTDLMPTSQTVKLCS